MSTINELAKEMHDLAVSKGWWDEALRSTGRTFGDLVALLHSEVSEMYEDYRNGFGLNELYYEDDGKPCGIPIEYADLIIRALENCQYLGIDIERAIEEKTRYNRNRPYRHGGKRT